MLLRRKAPPGAQPGERPRLLSWFRAKSPKRAMVMPAIDTRSELERRLDRITAGMLDASLEAQSYSLRDLTQLLADEDEARGLAVLAACARSRVIPRIVQLAREYAETIDRDGASRAGFGLQLALCSLANLAYYGAIQAIREARGLEVVLLCARMCSGERPVLGRGAGDAGLSERLGFYLASLLQNLLTEPASLEGVDLVALLLVLDELSRSASPLLAEHARTALANMRLHAAHSDRVLAAMAAVRGVTRGTIELRLAAAGALEDVRYGAAKSIQRVARGFMARRQLLCEWAELELSLGLGQGPGPPDPPASGAPGSLDSPGPQLLDPAQLALLHARGEGDGPHGPRSDQSLSRAITTAASPSRLSQPETLRAPGAPAGPGAGPALGLGVGLGALPPGDLEQRLRLSRGAAGLGPGEAGAGGPRRGSGSRRPPPDSALFAKEVRRRMQQLAMLQDAQLPAAQQMRLEWQSQRLALHSAAAQQARQLPAAGQGAAAGAGTLGQSRAALGLAGAEPQLFAHISQMRQQQAEQQQQQQLQRQQTQELLLSPLSRAALSPGRHPSSLQQQLFQHATHGAQPVEMVARPSGLNGCIPRELGHSPGALSAQLRPDSASFGHISPPRRTTPGGEMLSPGRRELSPSKLVPQSGLRIAGTS